MKEIIHELGIKGIFGNDLLTIQDEQITTLEQLLTPYGKCVLNGCYISDSNMSAGYCFLDGKIRKVPAVTNIELPSYIVVNNTEEGSRSYKMGGTRPAYNNYATKVEAIKPTTGEYIEISIHGDVIRWQNIVNASGKLNSKDFEIKKAIDVVGFKEKAILYTDGNKNINFAPLLEESTDNYKTCKNSVRQRINADSEAIIKLDTDSGNNIDFQRIGNEVKILADITEVEVEVKGTFKGNNINEGQLLDVTMGIYINGDFTDLTLDTTLDDNTDKTVNERFNIYVGTNDKISLRAKVGTGEKVHSVDISENFTFTITNPYREGTIKIPTKYIQNGIEIVYSGDLRVIYNSSSYVDFNDPMLLNKNIRYDIYDTSLGDKIMSGKFINSPFELIAPELIFKELQEGRLSRAIHLIFENKYNPSIGINTQTLEMTFGNNKTIKWCRKAINGEWKVLNSDIHYHLRLFFSKLELTISARYIKIGNVVTVSFSSFSTQIPNSVYYGSFEYFPVKYRPRNNENVCGRQDNKIIFKINHTGNIELGNYTGSTVYFSPNVSHSTSYLL